jgi:hypothetical protein
MAQTRFTCTLTKADKPACQAYARVTITDSKGASARACPRHAVAALDGTIGAHVTGPTPGASANVSAQPLSCPRNGANSRTASARSGDRG